jgi:hypothetical protein
MIVRIFRSFSKLILIFTMMILSINLFAPAMPTNHTVVVRELCYKAEKLQHDLNLYVNLYQRHGKQTYCNVLVTDVADSRNHDTWGHSYGFLIDDYSIDISAIYPTAFSTMMMPIHRVYDRAIAAIKKQSLTRLTQEQAFYAAQKGCFVILITKKYNHMAIVFPAKGIYNPSIGCTIAQAGYFNGIFQMSSYEAFEKNYQDDEILFILCKELAA